MSSGVWRKALVYLGLVEEPEEHDELPEQLERYDRYAEPVPAQDEPYERVPEPRAAAPVAAGHEAGNVRPLRAPEPGSPHVRAMQQGAARVATLVVESFEDVERIGERYRAGQPVLFDLTQVDKAVARRVIDFVSGLTYALRGRLVKAGKGAFVLIPDGIDVSMEERHRLAGLGYELRLGGNA